MESSERAKAAREIMARLRLLRAEIAQEAARVSEQARRFNTPSGLTEEQNAEADAVSNQLSALEIQLDAINCALLSLACFGTM